MPLHHWELYLAGTLRDDGGDLSGTAPHLEANYGALSNLQLHLLFPVAFDRPAPGEGVRYGPGDLEAGFKWRFVEEGKWRPQVGIFPIFTFPTGSAGRGLGEGAVHAFLPLWIQKSFGPWTTYGGGGWKRSGAAGTHGAYFVGWLLQRQIVEGWVLGAEVFHDAAERSDERSETRWNLGTIIDLNEHVHLLGSGGLAFGAHATPEMYLALLVTL